MTTARQVWEGMLTELSKVNAPSLLLHEFNYYFNKAIYQYINKRYNIYDVNQQTTDDLRVLKATAILPVKKAASASKYQNLLDSIDNYDPNIAQKLSQADVTDKLLGATYEIELPDDYLHMLNCICIYKLQSHADNCYDVGDVIEQGATRLTADSWSVLVNDYYNRPTPWKPYYYIHNVNQQNELPTNPVYGEHPDKDALDTSKMIGTDQSTNNKFPSLKLSESGEIEIDPADLKSQDNNNLRKNPAYTRHANASKVKCEIRYGRDDSVYNLQAVLVDYIKAPQHIRLTKQQVDLTTDTSQVMEFPDYVCQEIINELTMLVMARTSDPRLQAQMTVSQSIANPQQAQATPQQTQQS